LFAELTSTLIRARNFSAERRKPQFGTARVGEIIINSMVEKHRMISQNALAGGIFRCQSAVAT